MLLFLLPAAAFSQSRFGSPMTDCLNDYVLQNLSSDSGPEALTREAFIHCDQEVREWLDRFPSDLRKRSYDSMHEFYVLLIKTSKKQEKIN
ncbi:hypothetical protein SOASR031_09800 [Leminorella grimontii]|nr:hypothetical protein SOASR031_09800 [Leminorella grimontii]